jgi:sugar phosphate isomerase/epimerase
MPNTTRRSFLETMASAGAASAVSGLGISARAQEPVTQQPELKLKYIVASCMYGYMYVGEILPEIARCGATHLDLWPKRHGNQREQLQDMGEELFGRLLEKHSVKVGCITQYPLGPFGLQEEMRLAKRLGCELIVTGGDGPKGFAGAELKKAVGVFVEKMKPHLAVAEEHGVTIAIENHANGLFETADSLRYLHELTPSKHLAIALAPYHLPQDAEQLAALIRELDQSIAMFYAWQHGDGCMTKLPKEQELLQLPGRGPLDFKPLLKALADIRYQGWTEVFMHPVPRGIPILETAAEVTAEIVRSNDYLQKCIGEASNFCVSG